MEIPKQLLDCLNQNKVSYEMLHHPEAVTAQRIAQAEHVKGAASCESCDGKIWKRALDDGACQQIIKSILIRLRKPSAKPVSLDTEQEFKSLFPDCATGAMPPFGNLYGLPTYVDKHLAQQDYIVFEAGTHTDAIKVNYRDYEKIVKPRVEDLAVKIQPMKDRDEDGIDRIGSITLHVGRRLKGGEGFLHRN